MGAALMGGTTSCDDFEEINTNPAVAGVEVVKAYYSLNSAIIGAQQDPHIAERIAVYNWASAARISGSNSTFLSAGRYDDGYCNDYHGSYLTSWIKNATMAITIATENEALEGAPERDMKFNQNVKSFARIWRVVMISEYTDNFGPYPIEAFTGTNPTYNSEKEVYYHMLEELTDAVANILTDVEPTGDEAKSDPLFGFNAAKWAKYGNSLRLRLAMRMSEVDRPKAKQEFEAAVNDPKGLITAMADIAKVKEYNQWNAWAGIYSRSWNYIDITSTMSNILTGLGGVSVAEQRPDLVGVANFKPMDYLGLQFADHYADKTDNPTKGYWMDGIPENLDPRALRLYCLPNDQAADNFRDYGSSTNHDKYYMKDGDGEPLKIDGDTLFIKASHTWNYYPAASRTAWSPKFAKNGVSGSYPYTLPVLSKTYGGDSESERVWFGPWETHFLLAEAALYGWNTKVSAENAYYDGIRTSFENFGVSEFYSAYIQSEDYNRIGVSVKFSHTTEPANFTASYVNGYDNEPGTTTYEYPKAGNGLYKNHLLNDQLAKIITQKYIAQAPYCSLEMWNDRRRLGLPWFDIPNNETVMVGYDMANTWTPTTYQGKQPIDVFPQRLRYPTSLNNADPVAYAKALELLGGNNTTITPLWWAIQENK